MAKNNNFSRKVRLLGFFLLVIFFGLVLTIDNILGRRATIISLSLFAVAAIALIVGTLVLYRYSFDRLKTAKYLSVILLGIVVFMFSALGLFFESELTSASSTPEQILIFSGSFAIIAVLFFLLSTPIYKAFIEFFRNPGKKNRRQ